MEDVCWQIKFNRRDLMFECNFHSSDLMFVKKWNFKCNLIRLIRNDVGLKIQFLSERLDVALDVVEGLFGVLELEAHADHQRDVVQNTERLKKKCL